MQDGSDKDKEKEEEEEEEEDIQRASKTLSILKLLDVTA